MTRPAVDVRRAGPADVEELLLLWTQAREEVGRTSRMIAGTAPDQLRPRLREALGGDEVQVLVARFDGQAAGYAILRVAPLLPFSDDPCLHVEHLFVAPGLRRHGVARALLTVLTSVAERHGADQVVSGVPPTARDTHRFLARLGFSPLVVRRVVTTTALRRKLSGGETRRNGLEELLARRRSLRARAGRPTAANPSSARAGGKDTLDPPVVDLGALGLASAEAVTCGPVDDGSLHAARFDLDAAALRDATAAAARESARESMACESAARESVARESAERRVAGAARLIEGGVQPA